MTCKGTTSCYSLSYQYIKQYAAMLANTTVRCYSLSYQYIKQSQGTSVDQS